MTIWTNVIRGPAVPLLEISCRICPTSRYHLQDPPYHKHPGFPPLTSSSFLQYPVLSSAAFAHSSHLGIHIWISQRSILQDLLISHLFHVIHPNKFARNCLPLLSFHAPCRDWINIFLIKQNWVRMLIAIWLALVICVSISSLWISRGQDSICFKFTSLQLLSLLCTWEFNK